MAATGRPRWIPPDPKKVEGLAAIGLSMDEIAISLGITPRTLYRKKKEFDHFRQAIERGRSRGNNAMANKLWELGMAGNLGAIIFFLKARAGWRDQADPNVNVTVNNGIPGGAHYSPEAIEARREEAKKLLSYFTLEDKIEYLAMCDRARARQAAEEQGQQIAAAPAAEVQAQDASPAVDQLQSANAEIEDDEGGEDG